MNWDAIGAIGEIVGAFAVVVSLLYVAGQIRQSNRQSTSESGFAFISESNRLLQWVAEPEIANVLVKLRSETALTPEEEIRTEAFAEYLLNTWWVSETSYQNGIMDKDMYSVLTEEVRRYLKTYPPLRGYFLQILSHFPDLRNMRILAPIYDG